MDAHIFAWAADKGACAAPLFLNDSLNLAPSFNVGFTPALTVPGKGEDRAKRLGLLCVFCQECVISDSECCLSSRTRGSEADSNL